MSLWRSVRRASVLPPAFVDTRYLEVVREVVVKAERALEQPVVIVPAPVSTLVLRTLPEVEKLAPSAWDPEPETSVAVVVRAANDAKPHRRDEAIIQQEIVGAKTLLLETVRRACFDWILYRTSRRMAYKQLADQAYNWLFIEREGTAEWAQRKREGKEIVGFENICEALDLDPDTVRSHVKKLTPTQITSIGRPAQYRKRDAFSGQGDTECHELPAGMLTEEPESEDTLY